MYKIPSQYSVYIIRLHISGYYATLVLSWTSTNVNWILAITGFGSNSITYPSTQGTTRLPLTWHRIQFFQRKRFNDDFTLQGHAGSKDTYNFRPRLHQIRDDYRLHAVRCVVTCIVRRGMSCRDMTRHTSTQDTLHDTPHGRTWLMHETTCMTRHLTE